MEQISLPSPQYYREIFLIPVIITVVAAVLPLSPLPYLHG